ncbi:hypothetical protein AKJ09_01783 [Labilithrix luteola]|uniref:IgGFc-binding protein N-terminal domain-containing protein n=2 Tax=Labilithrix luteola TaxID=1391654 RepID=A0A0K1PPS2_9BACT|nr:hypothetical protein AKJ09_01783 [Labilithrix luteola]
MTNSCHAVVVTNIWRTPATLKFTYGNETFSLAGHAVRASDNVPVESNTIAPGETIIVGLAGRYCKGESLILEPYEVRVVGLNESGRARAFEVESDVPVQIRSSEALLNEATLIGATTMWDRDYVMAMPAPAHYSGWPGGFIQIVGREDSVVEIRPREPLLGAPDLPALAAHDVRSYRLGRGEILQFVQDDDLTGSFIHSNKPVGVFAGAANFAVDGPDKCCDKERGSSVQVQVSPSRSLGDRYVAVRYRDRYEGVVENGVWRIVGAADGTVLTYEPATPRGAPTKLSAGEFAEFKTTDPFVVSSQDAEHSFALYGYMSAGVEYMPNPPEEYWTGDVRGAAEFTPVIPVVQYMKQYRFYTDSFYPETNLVVVRRRGKDGFADVVLDCAGSLSGWAPLGTSGDLEFTRVDLSRGNYEPQGNCKNGVREMHSDAPFTGTVWGWGSLATGGAHDGPGTFTCAASYAFSIGAGFRPIDTSDLPGGIH